MADAEHLATALEGVLGEPVDRDRFHGEDAEVSLQVQLEADRALMGQLDELRASGALGGPMDDLDERALLQRVLLTSAVLRISPESQPRHVAAPGDLEVLLLRLVAGFRVGGEEWPTEVQLLALRADAWLRRLGATRERWAQAAALLGLDLADALDESGRRRWWWPDEVPARPIHERGGGRPPHARPVVYLPDHRGPLDVLGLGDGWEPGQALVVGAGLVVDAWGWRPPEPRPEPQERSTAPQAPREAVEDDDEGEVAEVVPLHPQAVPGLEHLGAFHDWVRAGGS